MVDLKPGVIHGLDDRGYVRTTEGFGVVTRGCSDAKVWDAALGAVRDLRPNDWRIGKQLTVSNEQPEPFRIIAYDPRTFVGTTSYVGVYIHRLNDDTRMVEVTAIWRTRMTVTENPWEGHLLRAISARLPCVVPSEQALTGR